MLEILSEKIAAVLKKLEGKGRLTEESVDAGLREVRLALLEADVNFKVVKQFVSKIRERCITAEVLDSLTPAQQVAAIIHEELTAILGGGDHELETPEERPGVIMLVGLQGSGKTTTAAKLALHLRRSEQASIMVAADLQRPAAVKQLEILGKQLNIPVYSEDVSSNPVDVSSRGVKQAKEQQVDWVIVDTAGRLNIDEELMDELSKIKRAISPSEALLVVDAMTGQDAVRAAEEFHRRVGLTGLILTKMDGDARGGAALSISSVTGLPIKFIGVGEKADALEAFHPDRLASRILGMGDIQTLAEKARQGIDEEKAREMERKFRTATFTLEDFLEQMHQLREMGPLSQILDMIPGAGLLKGKISAEDLDEDQLKKTEAMILSMTPEERQNPGMIGGSRKRRICKGSGTLPQDVNQLLNQFRQMQKLMKVMAGGKGRLPRQELTRIFR
ncbi:MAG: signal recognition particle protein [Chloroflexi bacterium]|nr:signal recognition particle protein [Chloroflexota bacterium]